MQIWHLLQRVGFEGWVHRIASTLPWTRPLGKGLNLVTLPVRHALRPLSLPFKMRAAAAERAAVEAAQREAVARASRLPWNVAYRKSWEVLTFFDRKTGSVGSSLRGFIFGAG